VLGGVLVGLAAVLPALLECFYVNLRIGDVPIPISAVVALAANIALPWAMVRLTEIRPLALIPVAIWAAFAIILAGGGPGGDVIIPGNWQGIVLLLGGALGAVISVLVVMQPGGRTTNPPQQPTTRPAPNRRAPANNERGTKRR
jgi:hypothetical protein